VTVLAGGGAKYGSALAQTVIFVVPAGVVNFAPPPQARIPLAEKASRTIATSIDTVPHAPRIQRRRVTSNDNPAIPPIHHGIAPDKGELGGLFTTTSNCVVAGGYGLAGVLGCTATCPGEKTQIAFTGSVEGSHWKPTIPSHPPKLVLVNVIVPSPFLPLVSGVPVIEVPLDVTLTEPITGETSKVPAAELEAAKSALPL
jgi:hypothetical protein